MAESDENLLRAFAAHRDEASFRLLADRYLGLIFHTALRRTGNRPLAEEISQNVLCAVARKAASLATSREPLGPWLHRATLFESTKAMRSESSYQSRTHLVPPAETTAEETEDSWRQALPHLDGALDQLPAADREVLLLHFFEKRPFPGIAKSLGKSTVAVQKQSQRALEKLSRLLRARGVALSVAGITAGMAAEFAKAAPVALAKSAPAVAMAAATESTSTTLALMISSKSKALVPLAVLVCGIPLAIQQMAVSKAADEVDALHSRLSSAGASPFRSVDRRVAVRADTARDLDIVKLADEIYEARMALGGAMNGSNAALRAFNEKLGRLDDGTLAKLIQDAGGTRMDTARQYALLRALIFVLGERDPALAIRSLMASFPSGPRSHEMIAATDASQVMAYWTYQEPERAWAWLREQEASGKLPSSLRWSDANLNSMYVSRTLKTGLCGVLLSTGSPLVREVAASVPVEERVRFFSALGQRVFEVYGPFEKMVERQPDILWSLSYLRAVREFAPPDRRADLVRYLANGPYFQELVRSPQGSRQFLAEAGLDQMEKETISQALARRISSVRGGQVEDPSTRGFRAMIMDLTPEKADDFLQAARREPRGEEVMLEEARLRILKDRQDLPDDVIRSVLTDGPKFKHLKQEALNHAERIKDTDKRASVILQLNQP